MGNSSRSSEADQPCSLAPLPDGTNGPQPSLKQNLRALRVPATDPARKAVVPHEEKVVFFIHFSYNCLTTRPRVPTGTKLLSKMAHLNEFLLERSSLVDHIQHALHDTPCFFLVAPAGGGKTVLASQFAAHWHGPVVYWRLSPQHADPVLMLTDGYRHFREQLPGFRSQRLESLIEQGTITPNDLDLGIQPFLESMQACYPDLRPLVICDDLHHTGPASPGLQLLGRLIGAEPPGWRWLLCSRPPLDDGLKSTLRLSEKQLLTGEQLAMELAEVQQFFLTRYGDRLNDELAGCILEQTGGNPLLVSLWARGGHGLAELPAFLEHTLTQSDYQNLLKLAILPIDTKVALRSLLGEAEFDALLEPLRQLPGIRLTENHLYLHDLVRDVLGETARQRLPQELRDGLLREASRLRMREGDVLGTIECLLSIGDHEQIEALIQRHGMQLLGRGLHLSCRAILERIPESFIHESPGLLLLQGSIASNLGRSEARPLLERAIHLAHENDNPMLELMAIIRLLEYEGGIAGGYENLEMMMTQAERLFTRMGEDLPPAALAWTHTVLGAAYQLGSCDLEQAARHFDISTPIAERHELHNLQALIAYMRCHRHLVMADIPTAWRYLEEIHGLQREGNLVGVYAGLLALGASNILRFTGQHETNLTLLERMLTRERQKTAPSRLLLNFFVNWQAESLNAMGNPAQAKGLLLHALNSGPSATTPFLRSQIHQNLALTCALLGDAEGMRAAVEKSVEMRASNQERYQLAYHELTIGLAFLVMNDLEPAQAWLSRARTTAAETDKIMVLAAANLHLSNVAAQQGDKDTMRARLEEGLSLVERHDIRYLPSWLDEPVEAALLPAIEKEIAPAAVRRLVDALDKSITDDGRLIPRLRLSLIGGLRLAMGEHEIAGSELSDLQRLLLSLLGTRPRLEAPHEWLRAQLYPDSDDTRARQSLDTLLSRTRRLLDERFGKGYGKQYLLARNGYVQLRHVRTDLARLEADLAQLAILVRQEAWCVIEIQGLLPGIGSHLEGTLLPEVIGSHDIEIARQRIEKLKQRFHELSEQSKTHFLYNS